MAQRYNTGNPRPSNSMKDVNDNALANDDYMNSEEDTFIDRIGDERDTLRGSTKKMIAAGAAVVEETRQNLIPLSKQYTTLAEAQNDIANIPPGSTTYYRSPDDSALAVEVINNAGTLEATGRRMISQEYVDALIEVILQRISPLQESPDSLFDIVSANGIRPFRVRNTDGIIELQSIARLVTGDYGLNFNGSAIDNSAPDGWKFLIYSMNGLVIAGVKDDGTKVGWGGSDSGGGQSGGITPGDVAVGYDDIRNYTGEATVRDVVGVRIAGRFVVDASDTDSPDDGGGVLVGLDGRRWVRQCDFVSYDMFGAPRIIPTEYQQWREYLENKQYSDAADFCIDWPVADAAMVNCHQFANRMSIPVVQNTGIFLWSQAAIPVKTEVKLTGASVITTDASGVNAVRWGPIALVDESAPEPVSMFNLLPTKEPIILTSAQLSDLNNNYSQYFKAGSVRLPVPWLYRYRGSMLYLLSNALDYLRNGDSSTPRTRTLYRDFTRIGKNGGITDMFVKDIPAGTIARGVIIQKEDSYLRFDPPYFHEGGNSRRFVNVNIKRPQVIVGKMTLRCDQTGVAESWAKISAQEVFDVHLEGGQVEASFNYSGAYGLYFRDMIAVEVNRFDGQYGWGITGNHSIKKMWFNRCTMNRIDWHSFGYDVSANDCELKGQGINIHGGNMWSFKNLTHIIGSGNTTNIGEPFQAWTLQIREDYASDCDGVLTIDGLVIRFDAKGSTWFPANTNGFDVVRLIGSDAANEKNDTHLLNRIDIRNVTIDLKGIENYMTLSDNFVFSAVRSVRANKTPYATTGYKTYLPEFIRVDGMTAINVPAGKNAWMNVFRIGSDLSSNLNGARTPRGADGTNAQIIGRDVCSVVRNPVAASGANGMIQMPGDKTTWSATYAAGSLSWVPKITLDNCYPAMIDIPGALAVVAVTGGSVGRYNDNDNGARCRINGADIQLIPDAAGAVYFNAQNAVVFGSTWLNPAGSATYIGTMKGAANERRGDTARAPNIPTNVFI